MTVKSRKLQWWSLLLIALGGTALFLLLLCVSPRESAEILSRYFLWPLLTIPTSVLAFIKLRDCYRIEPLGKGFFHLSLTDAMALSFFTGLVLAIFKSAVPDLFAPLGIPYALGLGSMGALGSLFANRKKLPSLQLKYAYALSFSSTVVGGFVTGGFVVILAVIGFQDARHAFEPIRDVLGLSSYPGGDRWIVLMFRIGLILVALGIAGLFSTRSLAASKR